MFGIRTLAQLRDEELDSFRSAMAEHVGADEAARLHWVRRAARREDGEWHIEVAKPTMSRAQLTVEADGRFYNCPWSHPPAMGTMMVYLPLAEGVALLTGADNPEDEVARRRRLAEDHHQASLDEDKRRRQEAADRLAASKRYAEEKPQRWAALTREQRALYLAAETLPRLPSQGLIAVAKILGRSDDLTRTVSEFFENEKYGDNTR